MIKRYYATKDNTISDAFEENLSTRSTGSNAGQADILETFTIYGQVSSSVSGYSKEKSRILIQFDVDKIQEDIDNGIVPSNAQYYLKMYNASHSRTLPRNYTLEVLELSAEWQEGTGVDLEFGGDLTYDIVGSNWIRRSGSTSWSSQGGDITGDPFNVSFPIGNENLETNITSMVTNWRSNNYGAMIRFSSSLEDQNASYYTKRFYARTTDRYYDKPIVEARWDDSKRDDRGAFYASSSLAPAADNLNTLYLYNYVRGRLTNIPAIGTGEIYVDLYATLGASAQTLCIDTPATGGWVSTGIYSCSVCISTTETTLYDVWRGSDSDGSVQYHTGTIDVKSHAAYGYVDTGKYIMSVSNRQKEYYCDQTHRIRIYARNKDWSPSIYTTATNIPNSLVFESASYQVYRIIDDRVVIPYDTGSNQATRLSYDVSGNYFDLDTSYLEPNYSYGINFSIYDTDTATYEQQAFTYKFRVVKNEY